LEEIKKKGKEKGYRKVLQILRPLRPFRPPRDPSTAALAIVPGRKPLFGRERNSTWARETGPERASEVLDFWTSELLNF
jgi:hypothetical protein